jgi:hypothetical protein
METSGYVIAQFYFCYIHVQLYVLFTSFFLYFYVQRVPIVSSDGDISRVRKVIVKYEV